MKSNYTDMVIETHLELVKDAFTAEDIKANTETFGKSNWRGNLPISDLEREVREIYGNKASVANHNHLLHTTFPIYSDTVCVICAQDSEGCSGINKNPDPMVENGNRDDRHQVTFVKGVREFYKRHAISSSLGIRSTEGILWGSIARALSSTSLPESPTATSFSFTTETYLPGYLVTSSLKCSTIQRSSLSIAFSWRLFGKSKLLFIPKLSDFCKSIIDRSGAMLQTLSPKGVIPASKARRESFLKQRKIPDKPE